MSRELEDTCVKGRRGEERVESLKLKEYFSGQNWAFLLFHVHACWSWVGGWWVVVWEEEEEEGEG